MPFDILIVDDEEDIRDIVSGILSDEGYEVRTAFDSDSALAAITERVPRLIFLDIWLQGSRLDGLALLNNIKVKYPDLPVVMISGHGNIETAVTAIQRGAYNFIEKPFKAEQLIMMCEQALEIVSLKKEIKDLKNQAGHEKLEFIGTSQVITKLKQDINKVAQSNARIMITGPSGSGKELAARMIHQKSKRNKGPFVILNAASITPESMEVALFGTEYADDHERKIGALEESHGGILFIEEIADMPMETQKKIARTLTEQKFTRVGGGKRVKVDVRILSSTSSTPENLIEQKKIRKDLLHRLSVMSLEIPALHDRIEDIPFLADHFMKKICKHMKVKTRKISEETMSALQSHSWPGNIRQFKNIIERLIILSQEQDISVPIEPKMLPDDLSKSATQMLKNTEQHIMSLPMREAREVFEKEYLLAQMNRFGGNVAKTANFVGMERSALHRKLRLLGL